MSIISGLLGKEQPPAPQPTDQDLQPMSTVTGRDVPGLTDNQIRAAFDIANSCEHEDHYLHPYCIGCALFLAFELSKLDGAKQYTNYAWVELKRELAEARKELADFQRHTDSINEIKTGQYSALLSKADDLETQVTLLSLHPLERALMVLDGDEKPTVSNLADKGGFVVAQVKAWANELVEAGRLERFKDGSANCLRVAPVPVDIKWPAPETQEEDDDDTDQLPTPAAA